MKWRFDILNKFRIKTGDYSSRDTDTFGAFSIPQLFYDLKILATDGEGFSPKWEHVSVSLPNRNPNWDEMCFIKDLFWDKEETVIQIHPPKSKYVNQHQFCLHLWRNPEQPIILPPKEYIGIT